MKTPDGQEFVKVDGPGPVRDAARAFAAAGLMFARGFWKVLITTWRLAAALDSALYRAMKLVLRRLSRASLYVARLAVAAFRSLVLWLPTRVGRAYSAFSGLTLIVAGLWIVDELRAAPGFESVDAATLRPPVDTEDPILARIEGAYVHLSEIEAAARAAGFLRENETLTPMMAFERGLVETYVEQRLLARAALDRGLQRAPTVLRRVNAARDRVLAATYLEREIGEAVTPETVKRFFDANADVTKLGEEVRARHILVETEAEAAAILAQLRGGADFDAVAREQSLDRATAPLGGAVGWFSRPMMTPAFSRAAFATATGEFSDPFLTEFGWHVVEVLGRRSSDQVPFDEVEASISEFLRLRTIETTLKSLVEDNQVVYFRPDPSLNARARAATGVMDASLTDAELR